MGHGYCCGSVFPLFFLFFLLCDVFCGRIEPFHNAPFCNGWDYIGFSIRVRVGVRVQVRDKLNVAYCKSTGMKTGKKLLEQSREKSTEKRYWN